MKKKTLFLMLTVTILTGILLFVASCKKDEPEPPTPIATSVQLIEGAAQSAFADSVLANPIEVLVKDQDGKAFAGAKVSFTVSEGSVSSATVNTNAQGKASVSWTLGSTVGSQTLTIKVYKADGKTSLDGSPISVNATAMAEVLLATSIELASGAGQSAVVGMELKNDIKFIVRDQNGDPFGYATVNFEVSEGSVSSATAQTDTSGITSVSWTLGTTLGTQTLIATAFKADGTTPLSGSPVSVRATAKNEAKVATSIEIVSGADQSTGNDMKLENDIKFIVKDQNGDPFRYETVTFEVSEGSISSDSEESNILGNVSVSWTLGSTPGTQTLTATAFKADGTTPLNGSPLTINATAIERIASTIELESGADQTGGVDEDLINSIRVRIRDQYGNTFQGTTVHFAVTEGAVSSDSEISDLAGYAKVDWTLGPTEGTQSLTITAFMSDGTTPLTGSPMIVNATAIPKQAGSIELESGGDQSNMINSTLTKAIVVAVKDEEGLSIDGVNVNFELTEGSVTNSSIISNNGGNAFVYWTLGPTGGTQTLTVTAFKNDGVTHVTGSPLLITATATAISASDDVTDYDGNEYPTVKIGDQIWMAENLKVTHYADGTEIPLIMDVDSWIALPPTDLEAAKAYTYYNFDSTNNEYGLLYSWVGAMNLASASNTIPSNVQGVCPTGWHLPSKGELYELNAALGGSSVAGGALKETGLTHWKSPNYGATNSSGFNGLPGGGVKQTGVFGGLGTSASFWLASQNSYLFAEQFYFSYNNTEVKNTTAYKDYGLSVRCVKD